MRRTPPTPNESRVDAVSDVVRCLTEHRGPYPIVSKTRYGFVLNVHGVKIRFCAQVEAQKQRRSPEK